MPDLDALYQRLISSICEGSPAAESLVSPAKLSASEQLRIYQGSVRGSLIQALSDIFSSLKRALGAEFFDAMADRYVRANPSISSSLDDYGALFPEFVADFPALAEYPYMSDLAQLDWLWHRLFHAPHQKAFDPAELLALSEAEQASVRLHLQSALCCLVSEYPLLAIWQLNQDQVEVKEAETIDFTQGGQVLVIWRDGLDVRVSEVDALMVELIDKVKCGEKLGTILNQLGSKHASEALNHCFAELVKNGWITGFEVETHS